MSQVEDSSIEDPLWYKDAVIYELHVKAFFDSSNDGIGDFKGLTSKLDYLQDLGVTALWILPFYPSPFRDDGYDIADYRSIHPEYGTIREFKQFLKEAHKREMRVITELVVNHTSDQHPWFQAARQAKPGSRKREMYVWSDTDEKFKDTRIIFCDSESSNWAWDSEADAYYWHRFYSHQPDLNHNNPRVTDEVIKILRYWLDMGVDGFRLDAVPYLCVKEGTNNENLPETHDAIKRIRKAIDDRYENRMLLAEANQWPDDVRPYFGEGDECHMAYHFPLMPRIFISLRKEDRDPIVDIMEGTPDIPASCQWALFLRNHDELTLEMVTDDERDYMWREYAADTKMRVNMGIRRRLAPLVHNSVRRLELLNSILFSFPGTPIIYYGDEIGMGDNIYLGDRNGVRTPMQWSSNRNAGFSECDPAKLYLPTIMDAVYGYERVNVEAQQRDSSSLLNFMKRIIALRKQYKAFGRGELRFLRPANRKILAYVRVYKDEHILCVVNLSRFCQPVELDLSDYNAWFPVELFGETEFPQIGELPYLLTLGPHSFYWFRLEREPHPVYVGSEPQTPDESPAMIRVDDLEKENLFQGASQSILEGVLKDFLVKQRWFRGKQKRVAKLHIDESVKVGARLFVLFCTVTFESGETESYVLPLRLAVGKIATLLEDASPRSIVCRLATADGSEGVLVEALIDRQACQSLLTIMHNERRFLGNQGGQILGDCTKFLDKIVSSLPASPEIKPFLGEQSNTSLFYGERLIFKLYRLSEPGISPEVEMLQFLNQNTLFKHVPRYAGSLTYRNAESGPRTIGILQECMDNDGEAWQWARQCAREFLADENSSVDCSKNLFEVLSEDETENAELGSSSFVSFDTLGRRTGELHKALASGSSKAFKPEKVVSSDVDRLMEQLDSRVNKVLIGVSAGEGESLPDLQGFYETIKTLTPKITQIVGAIEQDFEELVGRGSLHKIRCHGDYHLGQVLCSKGDFIIFDFEGEPLLPLERRKDKNIPLKDVAGMIRSLSYAAHSVANEMTEDGERPAESLEPRATTWANLASASFLKGYKSVTKDVPALSLSDENFLKILRLFLVDKVFYELDYELSYRPAFINIPLVGLQSILNIDRRKHD